MNIQTLIQNAEAALQALRNATDDPQILQLSDQHYIEISPASQQDLCVHLGKHDFGYATVTIDDEYVTSKIFDSDETNLLPVREESVYLEDLACH